MSVKVDNFNENQKIFEEIEKTGKYTYKPVYDAMPGRFEGARERRFMDLNTNVDEGNHEFM